MQAVNAVDNVSFEISDGEIVGLIGANGCGKSTLIKMMAGILKPTNGQLTVKEFQPYDKKKAFLNAIGVVLAQKNQLWWDLTPMDSFYLNKDIYQIKEEQFSDQLNKLVELLSLEEVLETPVRNLSLGERMKCELVLSLLHKPQVLFLDEPTIGLDYLSQKKVRDFLKTYVKEENLTLLITSHYTEDIQELCDRVIVLNKGEKVLDSTVSNIISKFNEYSTFMITTEKEISSSILSEMTQIVEYKVESENKYTLKMKKEHQNQTLSYLINTYGIIDCKVDGENIQELLEEFYK